MPLSAFLPRPAFRVFVSRVFPDYFVSLRLTHVRTHLYSAQAPVSVYPITISKDLAALATKATLANIAKNRSITAHPDRASTTAHVYQYFEVSFALVRLVRESLKDITFLVKF